MQAINHYRTGNPVYVLASCLIIGLFLAISTANAQQVRSLPDSIYARDSLGSPEVDPINETAVTDSMQAHSENEEKNNVSEDSVVIRAVPDSVSYRLRRQKDFAYANDPDYWKEEARPRDSTGFWQKFFAWVQSIWFRRMILVLLIGILLFAIFRIVIQNRLFLFNEAAKGKADPEQAEDSGTELVDLDQKILESVAANEYRPAIRFMYLKALKMADEKELIQFKIQSTNQEYVQQLAAHPQGKNFRFLTDTYEWVWYGGFQPQNIQFEILRNHFENFYQALAH